MEQVRRPAVEVFELRLRVTGKSKDFLQMSRPLCWPRELGEGWARVALYLGRIYLMIYDSCPFGVSRADFFVTVGVQMAATKWLLRVGQGGNLIFLKKNKIDKKVIL